MGSMKTFLDCNPLLPVVLMLMVGIGVGFAADDGGEYFGLLWAGASLLMVTLLLVPYRFPIAKTWLLLLAVFFSGWLRLSLEQQTHTYSVGAEKRVWHGILLDDDVERDSVKHTVTMLLTDEEMRDRTVRLTLLVDEGQEHLLRPGYGIAVEGHLRRPTNREGSTFDTEIWARTHGIDWMLYGYWGSWVIEQADVSHLSSLERLRINAAKLRRSITDRMLEAGLSAEAGSLLSAITLGDQRFILPEMREQFADLGISHLLCISGTHLAVIFFLLSLLLPRILPTVLRNSLLLFVLFSYVFLVGMGASVVRASLMISMVLIADGNNHQVSPFNRLAFAALVLLLFQPLLLMDIGFQLSFLSVTGILIFTSAYGRWQTERERENRSPLLEKIIMSVGVCFSAQMATLPIVLHVFGTISPSFLLTNLLVIPLFTLLIYATSLLILFLWFPLVSQMLAYFLTRLTAGVDTLLHLLLRLPGISLHLPVINWPQAIGLWMIIGSLCVLTYVSIRRWRH